MRLAQRVKFLLLLGFRLFLVLLRLCQLGIFLLLLRGRLSGFFLCSLGESLHQLILLARGFQLPTFELLLQVLFLHALKLFHRLCEVLLRELLVLLLHSLSQPLHQLRLLAFRLKLALFELFAQFATFHVGKLSQRPLQTLLRQILLAFLLCLGFLVLLGLGFPLLLPRPSPLGLFLCSLSQALHVLIAAALR